MTLRALLISRGWEVQEMFAQCWWTVLLTRESTAEGILCGGKSYGEAMGMAYEVTMARER